MGWTRTIHFHNDVEEFIKANIRDDPKFKVSRLMNVLLREYYVYKYKGSTAEKSSADLRSPVLGIIPQPNINDADINPIEAIDLKELEIRLRKQLEDMQDGSN